MKIYLFVVSMIIVIYGNSAYAADLNYQSMPASKAQLTQVASVLVSGGNKNLQGQLSLYVTQKRAELMASLDAEVTTVFKRTVGSWVASEDLVKLLK